MTTPNALTAAIRAGIAQLRKISVDPTPQQLAEDAQDALDCIEVVMSAIAEITTPAMSERMFLGLQLLRASCDYARALAFLFANNPVDLAGAALVLHRAQIESFLRAVFFSQLATEDELTDFFDNDQGPRHRTDRGKWVKISVPALAVEVQEQLACTEKAEPGTGNLGRMVANAWDPLCGMVHGGRAVHELYVDGQRQIGCSVPAPVQYQVTVNAVAIVNFCLAAACTISGWGGQQENSALDAPLRRFHLFVEQHNARLRSVGLHDMQRHIDGDQ
ncbi:DUF6988 family protein [Rhodanobacter umsongensis]|uniref:DUF6988 family protein n=1 Tax=Rhodanobacter umsongensis TaxID=633153 RepID=A0ABW0JJJ3_9GAMM